MKGTLFWQTYAGLFE